MHEPSDFETVTLTELEPHIVTVRETGFVVVEVEVPVEVRGEPTQSTQTSEILPERIVVEDRQISVVSEAAQGPAGRSGTDSAAVFTMTAGMALSGHRAIAVLPNGTAGYAEPDEAGAYIGLSTHAALEGAPVTVALRDTITESSWSWQPGQPVYFAPSGVLTQTVPATVALTRIGVAISPTTLLLQRETPIFFGD